MLSPLLQMLLTMAAGLVNQRQLDVIYYLRERFVLSNKSECLTTDPPPGSGLPRSA
jgi:hypothetical protein